MKNSKAFAIVLGTLPAVVFIGCSTPDRMVQANYSQIQQNVHTQADVEALIGPPSNKLGDMWLYERPDQHVTVMIDFDKSGRVTRKQWVGGLEGTWHDTKEVPKP